jgi:histidinol-phosphate aminotransferase
MSLRDRFERPQIRHFEPYAPGRDLSQIRKQYGLRRVVKLASNENAWGASALAARAVRVAAAGVYRYPEGVSTDLRTALARKHKVFPSRVIVGAGSDEIIELLGKAFLKPADDIVVSAHAFVRYRMAGELMGCRVRTIPMKSLRHDLPMMAAAVTRSTKFVFIANPNNPTGTYNTLGEVRNFLSRLPSRTLSVWDEAYFEYARTEPDYGSILENHLAGPKTIILRTFSKVYGLAGLRVGYAVAPPWVVSVLDRIRPPFNVSTVAQAGALAALGDAGHVRRSVERNLEGRECLCRALDRLGIEFVPSCANFLLVSVAPRRGREVFSRLLEQGVIVRAVEEYGLPRHIRVTVGTADENRIFLRALEKAVR